MLAGKNIKGNKSIILTANTSWYLYNFRLNLMLHLQSLGYSIIAIAPEDNYSSRFAIYDINFIPVTIDNKGTHPLKDFLLICHFIKLFFFLKPDCILSYTPKCNIYGSLAAGILNTPIINNISGLGTVFIQDNFITRIVKCLYVVALKKSAKVFFQNNDDLQFFISLGLAKAELADLLPGSGVDVKRFIPSLNLLPSSSFIFLLVARMLKDKGVVEFVTAAQELRNQYPHIRCQLLGFLDAKNPSAISAAEMQAWVSAGQVEYLGVSDSVLEFLQQADCVVLPSYREGVPRSLLEAASVAKPIITTDAVGCREVVDDGVNGFLCEPRSINDLKVKMEQMLLLSEDDRKQMGLRGREKMLREFNEQIVIDRYVKVITDLFSEHI